jgi:catechol 2,3-dioxygenase-like lactoylglutathione lyase family enzyme
MMGRLHHVVLDTADPVGLAHFYSQVLGLPITFSSEDWVVVAANDKSSGLAFQYAPGHVPPTWPDPSSSQQFHLDIMVEDIEEASTKVQALGARELDAGDHVFIDPCGHPFCLIKTPGWAASLSAGEGTIRVDARELRKRNRPQPTARPIARRR